MVWEMRTLGSGVCPIAWRLAWETGQGYGQGVRTHIGRGGVGSGPLGSAEQNKQELLSKAPRHPSQNTGTRRQGMRVSYSDISANEMFRAAPAGPGCQVLLPELAGSRSGAQVVPAPGAPAVPV